VYLLCTSNRKHLKIFTGIKVPDDLWDKDHIKKSHPHYEALNCVLQEYYARLVNAGIFIKTGGFEPTIELIKKAYEDSLRLKDKPHDFWKIWSEYMAYKRNIRRNSTCRTIRVTGTIFRNIEIFDNYLFGFQTFNIVRFSRFIRYLQVERKLEDATINRYVSRIKAFWRWVNPDARINFMKFEFIRKEEILFIQEDELKTLIKANLKGCLERTRDQFVFLCITGLRYGDFNRFNPKWITMEGTLDFYTHKTGTHAMPPIFDIGQRILNKYGGNLPRISNQKFNKNLKAFFRALKLDRPVRIQEHYGKIGIYKTYLLYEAVSNHVARKMFITLCLRKGIPIQDVMMMSGHSDFKCMKPYIGNTAQHIKKSSERFVI
jgi:integrase